MSRTIKFKAWNTDKKEMISAYTLGADEMQIHPNGRGFFNAHGVSPILSEYYEHLIPLQFTGLMDKYDVEIYEGDILKGSDGKLREMAFNDGSFHYTDGMKLLYSDIKVGNIYENPELLNSPEPDFEFPY